MLNTRILAVIAGVLTCALVHTGEARAGDVYKYVDASGATLYTDKPIPGAVLVSTGSQRPAEAAARNTTANQAATNAQLATSNQRIAETQTNNRAATTVSKDLEASRAERCKIAREQYQTAITSARLYRETPDGQRVYMSSEETDRTRLEAAKQVEAICGPQG